MPCLANDKYTRRYHSIGHVFELLNDSIAGNIITVTIQIYSLNTTSELLVAFV